MRRRRCFQCYQYLSLTVFELQYSTISMTTRNRHVNKTILQCRTIDGFLSLKAQKDIISVLCRINTKVIGLPLFVYLDHDEPSRGHDDRRYAFMNIFMLIRAIFLRMEFYILFVCYFKVLERIAANHESQTGSIIVPLLVPAACCPGDGSLALEHHVYLHLFLR